MESCGDEEGGGGHGFWGPICKTPDGADDRPQFRHGLELTTSTLNKQLAYRLCLALQWHLVNANPNVIILVDMIQFYAQPKRQENRSVSCSLLPVVHVLPPAFQWMLLTCMLVKSHLQLSLVATDYASLHYIQDLYLFHRLLRPPYKVSALYTIEG